MQEEEEEGGEGGLLMRLQQGVVGHGVLAVPFSCLLARVPGVNRSTSDKRSERPAAYMKLY